MTSAEQSSNSPEHSTPQWELLDPYIRRHIRATAESIEFADQKSVFDRVHQLNNYFISDGLIGLKAKGEAELPVFMATFLTDKGVDERIVAPDDLRQKKEFEGIFRGCVAAPVDVEETVNLLFYDFELESEAFDRLHVYIPVDNGSVKVAYTEAGDWDREVDGAFAVLETIEDDTYQAAVEGLRNTFWNTDQPQALRFQTIGIHAAELLSYEVHVQSSEAVEALGMILLSSLDEDLLYYVKGYTVDETRERDGRPLVAVTHQQDVRILKPVGVRYITNFEVIRSDDEQINITLKGSLQPAFTFFDVKQQVEYDYPLRYLTSLEECEYDEASIGQARVVREVHNNYGSVGGKTCGELSREYDMRHSEER